ncbi:MAG: hypothetical protein CM15mP130_0430 [Verrucomicrobiota bacterium]|nr:MAG: hypothetical protein CM15mP130_0430 [Verrucomicrobiota bacterium]
MVRFGKPSAQIVKKIIAQLDPHFPAKSFEMNWLLCETLAFLKAPNRSKGNIPTEQGYHARRANGICPVTSNLKMDGPTN